MSNSCGIAVACGHVFFGWGCNCANLDELLLLVGMFFVEGGGCK